MSLHVLRPGLACRIVDLGRPATRSLGMPVGGAADQASLCLANALLGNEPGAAALEVMLAGPRLVADAEHVGVFWGQGFDLKINHACYPVGKSFQLRAGDRLDLLATPAAACGYLCLAGGFTAPELLGSRSALAPITAGAVLAALPSRGAGRHAAIPPWCPPETPLRVLMGSHAEPRAWAQFLKQEYTVLPDSNRMGIRLQGENPLPLAAGELVSAPVCPGTIQLPSSGQPIILGRDAQTVGGYPRLGHVIAADLDRLANLRPGAQVRFVGVSVAAAQALAQSRRGWLELWQVRLRLNAHLYPVTLV